MSNMWADAEAARLASLLASIRCPKCGGINIADASPAIELIDGRAECSICSHVWIVNQGDWP